MVIVLVFWPGLAGDIAPGLNMAIAVGSVTVVAHGVRPPVSMSAFPAMESVQPEWFRHQPEVARVQIVTLAIHKTDIFATIPDAGVRHQHGLSPGGAGQSFPPENRS